MYCTKCGEKLEDSAKFCTKCGAPNPHFVIKESSGLISRMWKGRIGRLNYFLGVLFGFVLSFAPLFFFVSLWGVVRLLQNSFSSGAIMVVGNIIALITPILIGLSLVLPIGFMYAVLGIRRSHDIGYSGWFSLLTWIPYLGLIFALFLLFKEGQKTGNQYGLPVSQVRGFLADIFNY